MSDQLIQSFNVLYSLYYKRSFMFVKSYVHDDMAAEDIASEALIKLWEKMKEKELPDPLPFLLTILKNQSLDYLKHQKIKQTVTDSLSDYYEQSLQIRISTLDACDPEEIFSDEIQNLIRKSLEALPEQTRIVFEKSRFENKSGKEIAQELGITQKGVEYHITKALKVFRSNLRDYLPFLIFFS